ncbi:MAG: protein jag, partial [Chloroflexi bacterium]|nr:protein jag [Chloroflexota bacterium]
NLEMSAKTVEEAIQRAIEKLGVNREEVEITVVKEGRSGIFGLGNEEAVVRVRRLTPVTETDTVKVARDVLEKLLALLGVAGSVEPSEQPIVEGEEETSATVAFNISGDDLGILIGRRGQTLACLQYIVRLIVGQHQAERVPIVLDVEGYKQRHYQELQALARQVAEQVESRGEPYTLRPMSAYERRIIHLTLADRPDVSTESIGQGESRRVVVKPKGQ